MRRYEMVSVDKLIPYERNARTHSDEQVQEIANSIKEFGFVNPVLIDGAFGIIAGHGRVMGAKLLGMTEVPCLFIEDLTEEQKRAYILADNKLAEKAGWDDELVLLELGELKDLDFDISLTGFEFTNVDPDDFGTDFEIANNGESEIGQMTFTLHKEQQELIKYAIDCVKDSIEETFGNTNKNGNALYEVVRQWAEQRK